MILFKLFFEFIKIGLFAIGGGLATIPFLYDLSEKTAWFSKEMLSNMIAVSSMLPGPLGVNISTYTGYQISGALGATFSTLGLIIPSIIIIIIVVKFLNKFSENKIIKNIFYGLRPASIALILAACIDMIASSLFDFSSAIIINIKAFILFIALFILIRKFNLHPIIYIAISAIIGCIFWA